MINRYSILLSSGTSSGKTTFVNAILKEVPVDERIITIEDTREINPVQKNYLPLIAFKSDQGERQHLPTWVVDSFNQYIALEPETRNSAVFNVNMAMSLWNNGLISAATETSDFDIRELRRRPMTIFIGCTIAQLSIFRPLIRILFQQVHDLMMVKIPREDEPHQVLLMLDEFYHVGRMDSLISKITISAGYGFRMAIIMQDIAQLDELYEHAHHDGVRFPDQAVHPDQRPRDVGVRVGGAGRDNAGLPDTNPAARAGDIRAARLVSPLHAAAAAQPARAARDVGTAFNPAGEKLAIVRTDQNPTLDAHAGRKEGRPSRRRCLNGASKLLLYSWERHGAWHRGSPSTPAWSRAATGRFERSSSSSGALTHSFFAGAPSEELWPSTTPFTDWPYIDMGES